jgi:transposase InsO family protein
LTHKETIISLITEANKRGARLERACHIAGISLRTLQRWKISADLTDKRKGAFKRHPKKISEDERNRVLAIVNEPEFSSLPPSQIVPVLADRGEYLCSESTFYRILRSAGMQHHRGRAKPPSKKSCPRLIATKPNEVYTWDITYLPTEIKGKYYYLYLFLDIYSRFIVGWHIDEHQNSGIASFVFKKICRQYNIQPKQLTLHADNGSSMKGCTMLVTMQNLGVIKSFSRPATSNDNPFSEALFKTIKYCPNYPRKPFKSIETANEWMTAFVQFYNHEHKHSSISFVTPNQRHSGQDKAILEERKKVYEQAKNQHPLRWSSKVRSWTHVESVYINPLSS